MQISWLPDAWQDYVWLQTANVRLLRKINKLLEDAVRHPKEGIGSPEPLKDNLQGLWSRRINLEHRLVYAIEDDRIVIFQCLSHYENVK